MFGRFRRWLICALVVIVEAGSGIGVVSGHVPSTGATVGLRFPILVGASAIIGSLGGVAVVAYRSRRGTDWLTDRRFSGMIGLGLSSLAGVILLPIAISRPVFSGGSVLVGVLGAALLSLHEEDEFSPLKAASAASALTTHQVTEGAVLAGAYVAGGVVGGAAAVVLTVHTVAETATVAGTYATAGQYRRGVAAVVFMQAMYVVAANVTCLG